MFGRVFLYVALLLGTIPIVVSLVVRHSEKKYPLELPRDIFNPDAPAGQRYSFPVK